ncbi:MAG TPA: Vms1/Ankzf1 family peptidyl-tRNA hydrolase [Actinomycetota bacterium]|nr:Vms1/Ankzf1 family peptidyl-tRNA hydrolase [Actinomycetota bacterium]
MRPALKAPADRERIRSLAGWDTGGLPVTTLYLDVDGKRRPRRRDYVRRAETLTTDACDEARTAMSREAFLTVCHDSDRIRSFVRDGLERRGSVRGLAMFACSAAGLWEALELSHPVRDRVRVAPRPHLVPLEALLELAETFCTVLVDRERARVFLSSLGEIEEVSRLLDDVPGQHDQGGWAQARLQRHIQDHVHRHLKHVADTLLRVQRSRPFDHLVLAGPDEAVAELERDLHDYARRRILERMSLPMASAPDEVLERVTDLEVELESRREREAVSRLRSEAGSGTGRAVTGMADTLIALEANRAEVLVVAEDLKASGVRCERCGHLAARPDGPCESCGGPVVEVPDLVEEAVELALRHRCRVETVGDGNMLAEVGGVGALLRF